MQRLRIFLGLGAAVLAGVGVSHAAVVNEAEGAGQMANNTLATAQAQIGRLQRNTNPNIFGTAPATTIRGAVESLDVDFYRVFAQGPGKAWFDIDTPPGTFNATTLSLFDADGTLLAVGSGQFGLPVDPGSRDAFDAFLGEFDIPATGFYYIAVSERGIRGGVTVNNFPNALGALTTPLTRPDDRQGGVNHLVTASPADNATFEFNGAQLDNRFGFGTYELHISGSAFANASNFVSLQNNTDFGSARGGASTPGGVDMKLNGGNIFGFASGAFQVDPITTTAALPTPEGFIPAGNTLQAWEIQQLGSGEFSSVDVIFGYDDQPILAAGIDEADLRIFHFDNGQWVEAGTVDPLNNEVSLRTSRFSPFVLGVVPEPATAAALGLLLIPATRRRR